MEDFRSKQKIRKAFYSRTSFFVLLVITLLLAKGAWGVFEKERESKRNLARVEGELAAARAREGELSASIEYLKTQEGMEEEIRDRFSVAKPGEEVILIVDTEEADVQDDGNSASGWRKVGDWLKGLFIKK